MQTLTNYTTYDIMTHAVCGGVFMRRADFEKCVRSSMMCAVAQIVHATRVGKSVLGVSRSVLMVFTALLACATLAVVIAFRLPWKGNVVHSGSCFLYLHGMLLIFFLSLLPGFLCTVSFNFLSYGCRKIDGVSGGYSPLTPRTHLRGYFSSTAFIVSLSAILLLVVACLDRVSTPKAQLALGIVECSLVALLLSAFIVGTFFPVIKLPEAFGQHASKTFFGGDANSDDGPSVSIMDLGIVDEGRNAAIEYPSRVSMGVNQCRALSGG